MLWSRSVPGCLVHLGSQGSCCWSVKGKGVSASPFESSQLPRGQTSWPSHCTPQQHSGKNCRHCSRRYQCTVSEVPVWNCCHSNLRLLMSHQSYLADSCSKSQICPTAFSTDWIPMCTCVTSAYCVRSCATVYYSNNSEYAILLLYTLVDSCVLLYTIICHCTLLSYTIVV